MHKILINWVTIFQTESDTDQYSYFCQNSNQNGVKSRGAYILVSCV